MINRTIALAIVAMLVILFPSIIPSATAASSTTLKRIFFLHRHGARTSVTVENDASISCGDGHCAITNEGKDMLMSLGKYLAKNYKEVLQIPDPYNVSFIRSNATDYARVAISAEAVIMGLFDGQDPLPFVDFKPKEEDRELVMWTSWPTWKIRSTYGKEEHVNDAWIREYIGEENMTKIGAFFKTPNLCAKSPSDCITYAQDVIAANASAGDDVPQWLVDMWPKFKTVVARFLANILGYNPKTSDYSKQIGSFGYPLATTAINFLKQQPATGSRTDLMKMYHVGAHDWTVFSLFTALGTWTPAQKDDGEQYVVQFAETVIMEVHEDDITHEQTVVVKRGKPTQTPGNHTYQFSPMPVQCIPAGKDAKPYTSKDGKCPIDDLWRFINSTAPASPSGQCYATPEVLKEQDCDTNDAPAPGSRCLFYRQNCPSEPCGTVPGGIVDPAEGYACQSAHLDKGTPFVVATMIALMAPSLLGGAIAGFYGATKLKSVLWRKKDDPEKVHLNH